MSRSNSKAVENKSRKEISLWLLVSFSVTLLFLLSTIGLFAYQKKTDVPKISIQHAQIEIQKQQILQQADVIETNWLHTLNPLVKNVRGKLLWSSKKQQGIMEFTNLPRLEKNQEYLLLIYDLLSENDQPTTTLLKNLSSIENRAKTVLISFTPEIHTKEPFKFELLLRNTKTQGIQPLLLAQP